MGPLLSSAFDSYLYECRHTLQEMKITLLTLNGKFLEWNSFFSIVQPDLSLFFWILGVDLQLYRQVLGTQPGEDLQHFGFVETNNVVILGSLAVDGVTKGNL